MYDEGKAPNWRFARCCLEWLSCKLGSRQNVKFPLGCAFTCGSAHSGISTGLKWHSGVVASPVVPFGSNRARGQLFCCLSLLCVNAFQGDRSYSIYFVQLARTPTVTFSVRYSRGERAFFPYTLLGSVQSSSILRRQSMMDSYVRLELGWTPSPKLVVS